MLYSTQLAVAIIGELWLEYERSEQSKRIVSISKLMELLLQIIDRVISADFVHDNFLSTFHTVLEMQMKIERQVYSLEHAKEIVNGINSAIYGQRMDSVIAVQKVEMLLGFLSSVFEVLGNSEKEEIASIENGLKSTNELVQTSVDTITSVQLRLKKCVVSADKETKRDIKISCSNARKGSIAAAAAILIGEF